MNKPDTYPRSPENPVIAESLEYWEREKHKALRQGEARAQAVRARRRRRIGSLLPRWERQMHRRLGKVQIILQDI